MTDLSPDDPSPLWMQAVDAIMLVVRTTTTRRHDVERTVELLRTLGAPVLGVVINGITCGLGIGFFYLALCRLARGFLLGTVEPEKRVASLDLSIDADKHLGNPAGGLGKDGDGVRNIAETFLVEG